MPGNAAGDAGRKPLMKRAPAQQQNRGGRNSAGGHYPLNYKYTYSRDDVQSAFGAQLLSPYCLKQHYNSDSGITLSATVWARASWRWTVKLLNT